jgi:hypothetical protein
MRMPSELVAPPAHGAASAGPAARVTHILVQFAKLQVPMALGALICVVVLRLLAAAPALAAVYSPGTYLFAIGDALFLTVPVVVWMTLRDRPRQQCLGIAVWMLAPLALIVALGELSGYAYLPWLTIAGYPALSLGMLGYLLSSPSEVR